jgi:hypothetical protein
LAAFLRALAQTGNLTVSAKRAGLGTSSVARHRKADEGFDRACRTAIAKAAAAIEAARCQSMPVPPWEGTDGVELAVRGGRAPGARRRVQIARCRPGQWTAAREDRFLAVLSATCNVKAACAAVRIAKTSAYAHRRRWPGFAESWQEALREGAIELEAALLARGTDEFPWRELPDELADGLPSGLHVVQMTATDALRLLQMRFAAERRAAEQAAELPSIEAVRDEILARLAAIRRNRQEQAAEEEAEAALRAPVRASGTPRIDTL